MVQPAMCVTGCCPLNTVCVLDWELVWVIFSNVLHYLYTFPHRKHLEEECWLMTSRKNQTTSKTHVQTQQRVTQSDNVMIYCSSWTLSARPISLNLTSPITVEGGKSLDTLFYISLFLDADPRSGDYSHEDVVRNVTTHFCQRIKPTVPLLRQIYGNVNGWLMAVWLLPYVSMSGQRWTGGLSWLAAIQEWQRGGVTATERFKVIGQVIGQDDNISLLISCHTNTQIHFIHIVTSPGDIQMVICWVHKVQGEYIKEKLYICML